MGRHECCENNGIFSGQGLALIIILAIVVIFMTCICGEEQFDPCD